MEIREIVAKKKIHPRHDVPKDWKSAECWFYVIRLHRLDHHYTFRINPEKESNARFSEHLEPRIYGELISPQIDGVNQVKILVQPDKYTDEERILRSEEHSQIGKVTLVENVLVVELSIPFQAFRMLLPSLSAGQIELLEFYGETLESGNARISGMKFKGIYNQVDYPLL